MPLPDRLAAAPSSEFTLIFSNERVRPVPESDVPMDRQLDHGSEASRVRDVSPAFIWQSRHEDGSNCITLLARSPGHQQAFRCAAIRRACHGNLDS